MAPRVPSSFAFAALQVARDLDLDLTALLIGSGISPMGVDPADLRISGEQAIRLVDTAQRMTGDDLLGLGNAPVPAGTLRMLCYATGSATTLGEALTRFAELVRSVPGLPDLRVDVEGARCMVRCRPLVTDSPRHIVTVAVLAALIRTIGWVADHPSPVLEVELPFPKPDNADDVALVLGTHVRYDGPEICLVLPASLLSARMTQNETSLVDYLAVLPAQLMAPYRSEEPLAARVQRMVEKDLDTARVSSSAELADALRISTPTLRRHLRAEGTSLKEIRDRVLASRAREALRSTGEPVNEIAARLGFSETSAFTRAFRRWTGNSPSAFRESAHGAVTSAARPDGRGTSA